MSVRSLLLAAALTLSCAQGWAQDAAPPVPAESPPRVPFSAFRMKPILDSQMDKKAEASSLVVQDMDEPYKPPKKSVRILKPVPVQPVPAPVIAPPANRDTQEEKPPRETIPDAHVIETSGGAENYERISAFSGKGLPLPPSKPGTHRPEALALPEQAQAIEPPAPVPEEEMAQYASPMAKFFGGVPLPPAKPAGRAQIRDGGPGIIERILASPSEGSLPRPPVSEGRVNPENRAPKNGAQDTAERAAQSMQPLIVAPSPVPPKDIFVQVPPGGATERIRDRRRRFGAQARMSGEGSRSSEEDGFSLSALMPGIRVGKLHDAEGVSPVLLPGHTQVVAAPDAQRTDNRGIPAEVIVFFRENSDEMEIGQMDVLASDVAAQLAGRPDLNLEIVGYAESRQQGPEAAKKMALARALLVRDYLKRQHIDDDRLTIKGEGDKTGIEPRDRVEMYFSR